MKCIHSAIGIFDRNAQIGVDSEQDCIELHAVTGPEIKR